MTTYLAFPFKSHAIRIITFGQGYNVQLNSIITQLGRHHFPVRVKESDLQFTIQCRSQAEYDSIRATLVEAQNRAVADPDRGMARLIWPERKIDYLGFIPAVSGGVRRFDYAPTLPLSMVLAKDSVNSLTTLYSTVDGGWKNITGQDIVNLYKNVDTEDPADRAGRNNPPARGGGGGRPAQAR